MSEARISPTLQEQLQAATLGDYEILAELGRGGMASVFLAHDLQLDRKVAIKVMHPQLLEGFGTEGMVERFKQEARTAAGLSHPNIIPIYAVRDHGHLLFFVMKFVEGRPLDSIIAEAAPLPVPIVRTILGGVVEGLAYAHRHGVIHRDVKPANIMIDREGRPVVTDFGVAKVSHQPALTQTGTSVGTPHYMSPEQCHAEPITGTSDQYSLGVVAYEMLTGKQLYPGESSVIIMFKHAYDAPPAREAFGPDTPPDLADALIRMLQKKPADRWPLLEDALPALRGDLAAQEHKTRAAMAALAAKGPQPEILARVSTPRSPLSISTRPATTPRPVTAAVVPVRKSWLPAAVVGAAVLAGVALMLWRPWASTGNPGAAVADTTALVAQAADTTPAPPPAAPVTVNPPPPVATEATPPPAADAAAVREVRFVDPPTTLDEGETIPLKVNVLDRRGGVMRSPVAWSTTDLRIASVRSDGMLMALAPGRVVVTATSAGRQSYIELEVLPAVQTISVTPASETLAPAGSTTLKASARRRDGSEVSGAAISWRSSDESVAVVSSTGRVTALAPGTTTISAASAGRKSTAQITVAAAAAAAQPPAPAPAPPPAAQPAEDAQSAVRDLVAAYARALESKDMGRVRAIYPTMSAATERQTSSALEEMRDLRVGISASGITVDGNRAQARVSGAWTYRGGKPLDINNVYRFERRAGGWVIVAIE